MQGEVPTWRGPHTPPPSRKCLPQGCRRFHLGERTGAGVSPGGSARAAGLLPLHTNKTSKQTKELSLTATLVKTQCSASGKLLLSKSNTRDPSSTGREIWANPGVKVEVKFYERWLYIALEANRRSCTPGDLPCHLPRSCCAYCSVGFSALTAPRDGNQSGHSKVAETTGPPVGGFSRSQHFIRHTAYITIGILQGTRQDTKLTSKQKSHQQLQVRQENFSR